MTCKNADAADAQLENDSPEAHISGVVGTPGVEVLLRVSLRPQGRRRAVSTGTRLLTAKKTRRTPTWNNSRLPGETEPPKRNQRPGYVQDAASPGQRPLRPRRPERVRRQAPLLWGRQQNAFADNFRAFRLMIAFVTDSERVLAPSVEVVLEVVRNSVSKQ